jgi:hypothetical protein
VSVAASTLPGPRWPNRTFPTKLICRIYTNTIFLAQREATDAYYASHRFLRLTMTAVVAATDFCENFATYQRRVQWEPIEVRSYDKVTGYYVSADDFERLERFLAASRRPYHPSELPDHLKAAVRDARMSPAHNHLNALLDDE